MIRKTAHLAIVLLILGIVICLLTMSALNVGSDSVPDYEAVEGTKETDTPSRVPGIEPPLKNPSGSTDENQPSEEPPAEDSKTETDRIPDEPVSPEPNLPPDQGTQDIPEKLPDNNAPGENPSDTTDPDITVTNPSIPPEDPEASETPEPDNTDYLADFIDIVKGELGIKEKKYNNVKYNTWYYGRAVSSSSSSSSAYAWCITFISWCANQAEIDTDIIPKENNAENLRVFYVNAELYTKRSEHTPSVGDIAFFGKKTANHAGIVVDVTDTSVTVIEGNSSDKVNIVTYKLSSSSILGYATPDYANAAIEK